MICLVATLVVVGLPCVSLACVQQVAAAGKVGASVRAHSLDVTSQTSPQTGGPTSEAPSAPAGEDDANGGPIDGIDFDAIFIDGDGPLSGNNAPGQRVAPAVIHSPAASAPETSPRPPRV